jgi:hypothetical protein
MVWLHLRKDRFPTLCHSKLMPHVAGPFKVLTKINDNSYILDLPAEFGVSTSFNVADLKPYLGEDEELPSRTTSVQEGEDEEDTTSTCRPAAPSPTLAPTAPSSAPPSGPITRARAREFNFVMMLKNEARKTKGWPNSRPCAWAPRTSPRGLLGLHPAPMTLGAAPPLLVTPPLGVVPPLLVRVLYLLQLEFVLQVSFSYNRIATCRYLRVLQTPSSSDIKIACLRFLFVLRLL